MKLINHGIELNEFFTFKLQDIALLTSKDFIAAKKVTSKGLDLMITGSRV